MLHVLSRLIFKIFHTYCLLNKNSVLWITNVKNIILFFIKGLIHSAWTFKIKYNILNASDEASHTLEIYLSVTKLLVQNVQNKTCCLNTIYFLLLTSAVNNGFLLGKNSASSKAIGIQRSIPVHYETKRFERRSVDFSETRRDLNS